MCEQGSQSPYNLTLTAAKRCSIPYWRNHMKYVVKKTAMYGSSTYGPYGSYQEALEASHELEKSCFSECFFTVECLGRDELKS